MLSFAIVSSALIAVLNAGCCEIHTSEATCSAEIGQDCEWLAASDARVAETKSGDQQCVSVSLAECLQTVVDTGLSRTEVCPPAPVSAQEPTCEFEECDDSFSYNILFMLDESGSVGAYNYDNTIDFVKAMITNDVTAGSPVAVYSFSNDVDTIYTFDEDQTSRTGVLAALENNKDSAGQYQGRCTDTFNALKAGVSEFENSASVSASDINYMFLITDGIPFCGCGDTDCETDVCGTAGADTVARLDAYNVRIFTMGIGDFDVTQIECLSEADDVALVSGFTSDDFSELEESIRTNLCPDLVDVRQKGSKRSEGMMFTSGLSLKRTLGDHMVMNVIVVAVLAMFIYGYCLRNKSKNFGYEKLADDARTVYGSTGNAV